MDRHRGRRPGGPPRCCREASGGADEDVADLLDTRQGARDLERDHRAVILERADRLDRRGLGERGANLRNGEAVGGEL